MRLFGAALALGLVFSLASTVSGQTPPAPTPAETEKTHEQLRQLRDGLLQAIEKKDTEAVLSFLDENVVITTQDGDELRTIQQKAGVRDYLERLLTGPNAALKVMDLDLKVDELTTLHSDNSAGVAWGSSLDHYEMADGDQFDMQTRWTATVVQVGGAWKLAALQVSSNLFENPVLAATKRAMYQIGAGALVVGLLLGFIVSWVLRTMRKRPHPA